VELNVYSFYIPLWPGQGKFPVTTDTDQRSEICGSRRIEC
jgi:hypothetical protein